MKPYEDLLSRLGRAETAAALADPLLDHLLAQPLSRFVEPEIVPGHLDAVGEAPLGDRALCQHLAAFCRRDQERAKVRGDRLGDYLTAEALALLRREAGKPLVLDRAFLESFVRQEAVRHLLGSVVEETLQRFVQALRPGGKNGLFGGLPKGPGLGLLTKMAGQIEAQVQRAAAAFVGTSLEVLLGRLVHILTTPETAEQLGRLRLAGLEALLALPTLSAWNLVLKLPLDELLAEGPRLIRHNLAREELREAVRAEAEALLAAEGARPLGDLLGERGVAHWRETTRRILPTLIKELVGSPGFRAWLEEQR